MAVFRRRRDVDADDAAGLDEQIDAAEVTDDVVAPAYERPAGEGPWDHEDAPDDGLTRLDLGALLVPGLPGMELRLDVDEASGTVVSVTAVHAESAVQIAVFAAPRSGGLWDEVREEIAGSLAGSGGTLDRVTGSFGPELLASLPGQGPDGRPVLQPVRFVGVDGPRWFVRGLFSGAAARDATAAAPLEAVLRATVVVRGEGAMAPGDVLALHVPSQVPEGMDSTGGDAAPAEEPVPERPRIEMPRRGPEITEIR